MEAPLQADDTRSTFLAALKDRANEKAWRTFDQLYRPMLVNYACKRGLSRDDAEDVTQLCVAVVVEQIGDYQHAGSFKTWLHTIVERRVCDHFRRRRGVQGDSAFWAKQHDQHAAPEKVWEQEWEVAHLRHCTAVVRNDIEDSTYAAFVAYAIEDRPAAEVAQSLGLTVNQVYVAKHRVMRRIRDLLLDLTGSELIGNDT